MMHTRTLPCGCSEFEHTSITGQSAWVLHPQPTCTQHGVRSKTPQICFKHTCMEHPDCITAVAEFDKVKEVDVGVYAPYTDATEDNPLSAREPDGDLRIRLRYIAGDTREVASAYGKDLDALAERYGLKRR